MKRVLWLVLVCLLTAVPVLTSCTQDVPEAPPKAETETTTTTPPPTPEPKPASFSVSGLTITPKEVTAGSSITIEVLVTNTGQLSGSCDVTLKIDETTETTEKVTLDGGASQRVTFTKTKYTAKTYSVSINGQSGTFVVKASPPSPVVQPPPPPLPPLDAFMKGIHFNDWKSFDTPSQWRGLYRPPATDQSLKNLAATGANWISVTVVVGQETIASTTIFRDSPATATDAELLRVINLAHGLGMRVMLFPSLILSNDPDHWWGQIGTAFTIEDQWQEWFASYQECINHYATFAQDAGVDMLSIGRELGGVTHRVDDWRRVIQEVRQQFQGPITYSSLSSSRGINTKFPHGEENRIEWWDALDYIGVSAYYGLTDKNDPTVAEIKAAWTDRGHIAILENLTNRFNKPILFTEIGYVNKDGANKVPGNFNINTPTDSQEQADCYQAALEVLWGKPWLKGIFWWQWSATSTPWPENPQGKSAEEVLKEYYLSK
jgi:hypothetical protein